MLVRPCFSERSHVLQAARTVPLDAWELNLEIVSEAIDDFRSPSLSLLPSEDLSANGPVEQDQLTANGKGCPKLSGMNSLLELLKEFRIAEGQLKGVFHKSSLAPATSNAPRYESHC